MAQSGKSQPVVDRAQHMSDELSKLSPAQRKEFSYILNTEHDLRFDEILKKVKKGSNTLKSSKKR
jgi:hypothetical protein